MTTTATETMTTTANDTATVSTTTTNPSSIVNDDEIAFNKALESGVNSVMMKNKPKITKPCFGCILKILLKIQRKPDDPKAKKIRVNFAFEKNVIKVSCAMDLMIIIGFKMLEEKNKKFLVIASIGSERLEHIIDLLQDKKDETVNIQKKPKVDMPKQRCKGGCGFWGVEDTDFYCSVCYKKKIGLPSKPANASKRCINSKTGCTYFGSTKFKGLCSVCNNKLAKGTRKGWKKKFHMAQIKLRAVYRFKKAPRLKQKNKKRCWKCKRKVGITGIECRCGYIFCGKDRYAEEHDCDYDHKQRHVNLLRQQLTKIQRDQFKKI